MHTKTASSTNNTGNTASTVGAVTRATTEHHWREATALLHDYVEWIRAAAGLDPLREQPSFAAELADLAGHYRDERAALYVAYLGPLAAGTIAFRGHDDGTAELKRMYVRPMARGVGLADRLIEHVVAAASRQGCHTVWLESLRDVMEPAIAVYRRNGFVELTDRGRTFEADGQVVMERRVPAGAVPCPA